MSTDDDEARKLSEAIDAFQAQATEQVKKVGEHQNICFGHSSIKDKQSKDDPMKPLEPLTPLNETEILKSDLAKRDSLNQANFIGNNVITPITHNDNDITMNDKIAIINNNNNNNNQTNVILKSEDSDSNSFNNNQKIEKQMKSNNINNAEIAKKNIHKHNKDNMTEMEEIPLNNKNNNNNEDNSDQSKENSNENNKKDNNNTTNDSTNHTNSLEKQNDMGKQNNTEITTNTTTNDNDNSNKNSLQTEQQPPTPVLRIQSSPKKKISGIGFAGTPIGGSKRSIMSDGILPLKDHSTLNVSDSNLSHKQNNNSIENIETNTQQLSSHVSFHRAASKPEILEIHDFLASRSIELVFLPDGKKNKLLDHIGKKRKGIAALINKKIKAKNDSKTDNKKETKKNNKNEEENSKSSISNRSGESIFNDDDIQLNHAINDESYFLTAISEGKIYYILCAFLLCPCLPFFCFFLCGNLRNFAKLRN